MHEKHEHGRQRALGGRGGDDDPGCRARRGRPGLAGGARRAPHRPHGFDVLYPATDTWDTAPITNPDQAAPPEDRDAALPDADRVQRVLADALTSGLRDGDRD
ncbi:MAG: hypothetical protein ACRDUV_24495 [Pseudonocardiaceae bacterium]